MNIENIKETNFTKDANNFPMTSDDNVLNKLDGFYDDTRLLGIELAIKALSNNKINYKTTITGNGSVPSVANSYVKITSVTVSSDIARRWLILAIFDNDNNVDRVVTCRVSSSGTQIGKALRFNATGGGGATYAFETYVPDTTRTYDFEASATNTDIGNVRVDLRMIPLGG